MKNLARLALLGAAAVLAAPFASATSLLTGSLGITDGPTTYSIVGGNYFFTPSTGPNSFGVTQPVPGDPSSPVLNSFYHSLVADQFASNSPSGTAIWSGSNLGGDTVTFFSSSISPTVVDPSSGQVTFTIYGYFTDSLNDYLQTNGSDSITFNPSSQVQGSGLLSEGLTAVTPEPSSLMLLGTGLMSAGGMLFRRRKAIL